MSIQPAQPQSIGGVLDTTFQLYKAAVVKMIPLSLLSIVASSPSSVYVFVKGFGDSGNPLAMLNVAGTPGYWLAMLATYLGVMFTVGASSVKMAAIAGGGDASVGTAVTKSLLRLPFLFIAVLLYIVAVTVGTILLIVPGVILSVSLLLFVGPCLFDNKGPIGCLLASHRLVWGNWWRTAAILAVGFIVLIVIYMIAALVIGIVTPLVVLGAGTENALIIGVLSGFAVAALVGLLMQPFYIALFLAIYWDLKLRKEGGDLAARVGALNPA